MSMESADVLMLVIGIVSLLGSLVVVFSKEIMRMAVGLGVFLIAIAGLYLLQNASFLAAAQVFIYVGGVLVLVLFAIMLVQRSEFGHPVLESRHDIGSASVAIGLFVMLVLAFRSVSHRFGAPAPQSSLADMSEMLLGSRLIQFELAGLLLLVGLVAVLVIAGGDDE